MTNTIAYYTKYSDLDRATLQFGRYIDGTIAILVVDADTGEVESMPTVCLQAEGRTPADGHIFIRDYGPTRGAFAALGAAGIVGDATREFNVPNTAFGDRVFEAPLLANPDDWEKI